jgi:hypothetical protein
LNPHGVNNESGQSSRSLDSCPRESKQPAKIDREHASASAKGRTMTQ